jgi:L-malate glycosyltransferase
LFPSRREGFGTVQVEAMACGLPCFVHNIEGITSFIIGDGVDGIIIQDENTAAYSDGIVRILADEAAYRAMSENARRKAVSSFSADVIDRQYRDIYERLFSRGN